MTVLDADPPSRLLAEGFARQVGLWAAAAGAGPGEAALAARAARALSLATSEGHVCLDLSELAADPGGPVDAAAWKDALRASGVCGTAAAPGTFPLVLDPDGRLYLHRYFDYERRLARRLAEASRPEPPTPARAGETRRLLERLFNAGAGAAAAEGGIDWQRLAAALALRSRFTVVSGGPGTGKTTTVVNLLACLLALEPGCRIALAAPTGKAAARLNEAIRDRAQHLDEALRARLPDQASTIHRLLGLRPDGSLAHDARHRLPVDALVVDEASMLDLALATRLLEAVPPHARIVLLGDKDQLAAVESGAVFAELGADPSLGGACMADLAALTGVPPEAIRPPVPAHPSPLHDSAVWLSRTYRFRPDSGLGRLAALVNAGDPARALAWLGAGGDPDVHWHAGHAAALEATTLARIDAGFGPFVQAVAAQAPGAPAAPAAAHQALAGFRILCARREGPRGVRALNDLVASRLRARLRECLPDRDPEDDDTSPWFAGRPVIVLDNDYVLRLFNGDVGLALREPDGSLLVHFPDAQAPGGFRALAPVRLPRHETAFAMTVHKSQGSEFDEVLVVLPERRSRVCTRELLYTAITRARRGATLAAPAPVVQAAIATTLRRRSGLLARLGEALQGAPES